MKKLFAVLLVFTFVSGAMAGEEKKELKQCPNKPEDCKKKIFEKMSKMGMIGVDGEWDEEKGVFIIESFFEESNGESAGLAVGDMLVKINGVAMADEKAYKEDAVNRTPGATVPVTFLRDGDELTVKVTLIPTPKKVIKKEITKHFELYHKAWWEQQMKEKKEQKKEQMKKEMKKENEG